MEFQKQPGRLYLEDARGKTIAEVLYPEQPDGTVRITHTFVDESLRGQGIAGRLMEQAARELHAAGKKVYPDCPYAAAWFQRHPEFSDVLA